MQVFVGAAERAQLRNIRGGQMGIARGGLQELLAASGESDVQQTLSKLQFNVGSLDKDSVPLGLAIKQLEAREATLRNENEIQNYAGYGFGDENATTQQRKSKDFAIADSYAEVVKELKNLVELQARNNEIVEKKQQVPMNGPGAVNDRRGTP